MARVVALRLRERWGEAGTVSLPATNWRHISVYERPHGP